MESAASEEGQQLDAAASALRRFLLVAQAFRHRIAEQHGLALTDTYAMNILATAGPQSIGDLASRLEVAPSTVTTSIDRLERARFARRTARTGDRRSIEVSLTRPGRRYVDDVGVWVSTIMASVPGYEIGLVTSVLEGLIGSLDLRLEEHRQALAPGSLTLSVVED